MTLEALHSCQSVSPRLIQRGGVCVCVRVCERGVICWKSYMMSIRGGRQEGWPRLPKPRHQSLRATVSQSQRKRGEETRVEEARMGTRNFPVQHGVSLSLLQTGGCRTSFGFVVLLASNVWSNLSEQTAVFRESAAPGGGNTWWGAAGGVLQVYRTGFKKQKTFGRLLHWLPSVLGVKHSMKPSKIGCVSAG